MLSFANKYQEAAVGPMTVGQWLGLEQLTHQAAPLSGLLDYADAETRQCWAAIAQGKAGADFGLLLELVVERMLQGRMSLKAGAPAEVCYLLSRATAVAHPWPVGVPTPQEKREEMGAFRRALEAVLPARWSLEDSHPLWPGAGGLWLNVGGKSTGINWVAPGRVDWDVPCHWWGDAAKSAARELTACGLEGRQLGSDHFKAIEAEMAKLHP